MVTDRRWRGEGCGLGTRIPVHVLDARCARTSAQVGLEDGEEDEVSHSVGLLPTRRWPHLPLLRSVARRLQGRRRPAYPTRLPPDCGQELGTSWGSADDGDDRPQDELDLPPVQYPP